MRKTRAGGSDVTAIFNPNGNTLDGLSPMMLKSTTTAGKPSNDMEMLHAHSCTIITDDAAFHKCDRKDRRVRVHMFIQASGTSNRTYFPDVLAAIGSSHATATDVMGGTVVSGDPTSNEMPVWKYVRADSVSFAITNRGREDDDEVERAWEGQQPVTVSTARTGTCACNYVCDRKREREMPKS
jgi:hypothetical protein